MNAWEKPFQLEMNVAHLVSNQAKHGCNFNSAQAHRNVFFLIEKIVNIDKELIPLLPPMLNKGTEYNKPFKLNGDFMKWPGEYAARVGLERKDVANRFTGVWYTPFDPSKTDKVKTLMIDLGWIPTEWNSKKVAWDANKIKREIGKRTYVEYFKSLPPDVRSEFHKAIQGYFDKNILISTVSNPYRELFLSKVGCYTKKEIQRFNEVVNSYCDHAIEVVDGRKSTVVITKDAMQLRKIALTALLDKGFKAMLCKGFWDSSPKITEDSFDSLDDSESKVLQLLRQRMVWAHRRSLIQGLIENMQQRPIGWHVIKTKHGKMTLRKFDGKLSGELNPCATPTARGRHRVIVNIPAAGAPFGNECRDMFIGDKRYDVDQYKPYNQRTKEEKGTIFYNDPIKKAGLKGYKHPEYGLVFTDEHKSVMYKVEFDKKTKFKKKVVIIKKLKGEDFVNVYRIDKHRNLLIEWDDGKWDERGAHAWRYFVKPGYDAFVGGDGAALELRMLAHYLNYVPTMLLNAMEEQNVNFIKAFDKNFTKAQLIEAKHSAEEYRHQVLSGDIHTHNQKLAGLPTRKAAKSFIYAFLYGAGAAKLGSLVGGGVAEGEEMKVTFLRECPCIPVLLDFIQAQAGKQGWIPAIDGRKLIMRRDATGKVLTHKALNTLLQAAGSIVMKYAMVVLHKDLKASGADAKQVIFMHDEYQFTCKIEDVPLLRKCIDNCVRKAGEKASDENYGWGLDMHCVLASDSMVGFTWVHTH